jgi:hypothetical protein
MYLAIPEVDIRKLLLVFMALLKFLPVKKVDYQLITKPPLGQISSPAKRSKFVSAFDILKSSESKEKIY